MTKISIATERLELIAETLELARAEISDRSKLSQLLNACVPETWSPEFNDIETMTFDVAFPSLKPTDEIHTHFSSRYTTTSTTWLALVHTL